MKQVIVITGASSGFGALAARALDKAGHIVYASMRESTGRNVKQVDVFSVRLNQAIEIGLSLLWRCEFVCQRVYSDAS